MSDDGRALVIVYNADGSVMGKIQYGYRKITCPKDGEAVCAACDITHGGLSLRETPGWVEAKKVIEASSDLKVKQLHRDELPSEVRFLCCSPSRVAAWVLINTGLQLRQFIQQNSIAMPVAIIVGQQPGPACEVAVDRSALSDCNGDARAFVEKLRAKGLVR